MKGILLPSYQGNIIRALRSLELQEIQVPELKMDEVLIEVEAASVNPSDLAFIQGGYNIKKALPAIPGFEGVGRVIKTGTDENASALAGKRLSFFSQSGRGGSWASHTVVRANDCIVIDENLHAEQAACLSVNPFTAYAMVMQAKECRSETIIQNAAAGQVGKFINALAEMEGMNVINIVRKEKHLNDTNYKNVLWSQQDDFRQKLQHMAASMKANIAYDAVGGEQSGHILAAMPEGSTLFLYGALGARTLMEIPASDIIFKKKRIHGFNMNEWKAALSEEEFIEISIKIQSLILQKKIKTDIQAAFRLDEYEKALMQYIRSMSAGKVLLKP
jgi:NADPH:quinone reductase-like Zn-dependent oxidoreductase